MDQRDKYNKFWSTRHSFGVTRHFYTRKDLAALSFQNLDFEVQNLWHSQCIGL